jgi:predicted transglutaminase-like protease
MRDEVTGKWSNLHKEELHNLYSSQNIIGQIKLRRMMWAGHVARMGEERKVYKVLWEGPKERDHLENRGLDDRMGSELIWL